MPELLKHILIVLVPLILTSIFHMVVVKLNWLGFMNVPVWQKGFGKNKTWRGVCFVPLMNAVNCWLIVTAFSIEFAQSLLWGYILGVAYLLFELPNSFIKRRVGITAGGSHSSYKYFFYILDKTDSAFGVTLTYFFIAGISIQMAIALFFTNSLAHVLVALVLISVKIKSSF